MKRTILILTMIAGLSLAVSLLLTQSTAARLESDSNEQIMLPSPRLESSVSIERSLQVRRSVRNFRADSLTLSDVSQLFWAGQGITNDKNYRTAPSAGALYPLELYLLSSNVEGLAAGIYKYNPARHSLIAVKFGDFRDELAAAGLGQSCLKSGSISIIITAVYSRTTARYGDRGIKYVHLETGHAAQNISLQAVALNLGTVMVGAFKDDELKHLLDLPNQESPLYIIPAGKI